MTATIAPTATTSGLATDWTSLAADIASQIADDVGDLDHTGGFAHRSFQLLARRA